jgi:hypothetical protein
MTQNGSPMTKLGGNRANKSLNLMKPPITSAAKKKNMANLTFNIIL